MLIDESAAFAAMADPHAYRQYIAGALPDPPESPFVPADTSRVDQPLQTRQLPAVPSWVQDPEKWQSLSRADRRALERHHRKQQR